MKNLILLQAAADLLAVCLIILGLMISYAVIMQIRKMMLTRWYYKALDNETDIYIHGSFELINRDLVSARKKIEQIIERRGVRVLLVSKYTGPWQQNTWYCIASNPNGALSYGQFVTPLEENTMLRATLYLNNEFKDVGKEIEAIATSADKLQQLSVIKAPAAKMN